MKLRKYTTEEAKLILELYEKGKTLQEIGYVVGRTQGAISAFISTERKDGRYSKRIEKNNNGGRVDLKVNGVKVGDAPAALVERKETQAAPKPEVRQKEMTPREMIKKLYDMGYRIENNQLVCIQKVVVKLQDILNG